jgi:hypothetical protein
MPAVLFFIAVVKYVILLKKVQVIFFPYKKKGGLRRPPFIAP